MSYLLLFIIVVVVTSAIYIEWTAKNVRNFHFTMILIEHFLLYIGLKVAWLTEDVSLSLGE